MKLLMVIASDELCKRVTPYIKPLGFDPIRYYDALKAMDNLDEITPGAVVMSARDFPKHWKLLLQFMRCIFPLTTFPFILLKGLCFSLEDAARACYLGATLLNEQLDQPSDVAALRSVLSAGPVSKRREPIRKRFSFMLLHPFSGVIVAGDVKGVSEEYLSFLPTTPLENVPLHTELTECSLRAGESVLSPRCLLTRKGHVVVLRFLSFPGDEGALFAAYLREK
jgi:hypothetical protein